MNEDEGDVRAGEGPAKALTRDSSSEAAKALRGGANCRSIALWAFCRSVSIREGPLPALVLPLPSAFVLALCFGGEDVGNTGEQTLAPEPLASGPSASKYSSLSTAARRQVPVRAAAPPARLGEETTTPSPRAPRRARSRSRPPTSAALPQVTECRHASALSSFHGRDTTVLDVMVPTLHTVPGT